MPRINKTALVYIALSSQEVSNFDVCNLNFVA